MSRRFYGRLARASALALTILLMSTVLVAAQNLEDGNVFPALGSNGAFHGTQSYIDTPDPPIGLWQWTDALTAVGQYYTRPYIEAGAHKYQDLFGVYYNPYGAAGSVSGNYYEDISDFNLAPWGSYFYQASYTWAAPYTYWGSYWCGSTVCYTLLNVDLETAAGLNYAGAGAESYPKNYVAMDAITQANTYKTTINSPFQLYCYNVLLMNVAGHATPCNNYAWVAYFFP